jgi:hypothetical protein
MCYTSFIKFPHSSNYEKYNIFGRNAGMSGRSPLVSRRNVLPPSSGPKSKLSKKPAKRRRHTSPKKITGYSSIRAMVSVITDICNRDTSMQIGKCASIDNTSQLMASYAINNYFMHLFLVCSNRVEENIWTEER